MIAKLNFQQPILQSSFDAQETFFSLFYFICLYFIFLLLLIFKTPFYINHDTLFRIPLLTESAKEQHLFEYIINICQALQKKKDNLETLPVIAKITGEKKTGDNSSLNCHYSKTYISTID